MDDDGGLPVLDAVEQRVLGALLEKERTVPTTYPMTLNGLRTACNQSSSRFPLTEFDDATIIEALDRLKARGLARLVHASHGSRMIKYRQVLDEKLDLEDPERALLTVLLLRGPNTPGELKTRTERLHRFDDRSDIEALLAELAARDEPMVCQLDRQPGQQDPRWIHLLGPVDVTDPNPRRAAGPAARPGEASEVVLADGAAARTARVRATYDTLAVDYAAHFVDELDTVPIDQWLLQRLVDLADGGAVADAGCGPGHTTFHLAAAGANVTGFDLSPAMVAEARRRYGSDLTFEVADLTDLPLPDDAQTADDGWAAICAWYSLVHLAASEMAPALALLRSRLRPGGWLALALHAGDNVNAATELLGHEVEVTFVRHDRGRVVEAASTAGFTDIEWYQRGPHEPDENTERLYLLARRPT
jgi:uncharacterized protein YceH (UPF0502 family)/SAM-dependent methyltransferase